MTYQPGSYPQTPPPQKPRGKAKLVLTIVLGVLILCAAGTITIGIFSDSGSDKATAAAGPTAPPLPQDPCGGGICQTKAGDAPSADTQDVADGKPGGFCATSELGKHLTVGGAQYTCGGPKPYRWLPDHSAAAPKAPSIAGDDLVHVGEDVPAGTYRAVTAVDGDCYWKKSKDAEGTDIIANDIPAGGRPQVTLKAGQWFTSHRCPDWAKK